MQPPLPPDYAELHCLSAFSFQRGASLPDELVQRAHAVGYRALALTDECSVAGMVRAHEAARAAGLKLLPGSSHANAREELDCQVKHPNHHGELVLCTLRE
jgi:error-prone DNA polymerase